MTVRAPSPPATYCTVYKRAKGFEALAEAELFALAGGEPAEHGVWLSETPVRWAETGYGVAGGKQLAVASDLDELRAALLALELTTTTFGITTRLIPRRASGKQAAKKVIADCIDGDPDYNDPALQLLLIVSPNGYRVLEVGPPGDATWLESGDKPHNYLVALPVRMAKAMLNMTAAPGDSVFDPFSGSGTIPLLAAWAGHETCGSDISWPCVTRARENIAHFGRQAPLTRCDARETRQKADCIVTNLPYGLYCSLPVDGVADVLTNLRDLAPKITLVSSEHLGDALVAAGYDVQQTISVEADRFERFIYVTRPRQL